MLNPQHKVGEMRGAWGDCPQCHSKSDSEQSSSRLISVLRWGQTLPLNTHTPGGRRQHQQARWGPGQPRQGAADSYLVAVHGLSGCLRLQE